MRVARPILLLLLLSVPLLHGIAEAQQRARVVVVKTLLLGPFEKAEGALVRELQQDMDVWVVPVVPGNPHEARRIAALYPDVIVTIGTQATAWVSQAIETTPIVFSMVLDPISGGFVKSFERPGGRATGAALDVPVSTQFRVMQDVLHMRRVAVLFNPETSGSTVRSALAAAKQLGVELVPIPVSDRTWFESALKEVDSSYDALWSVPDPVVFSNALSQRLLLHSIRRRIPLMGLSEQHVQAGALFALVTSHEENGRQAAERVRRVIAGEKPSQIPVGIPEKLEIVFNPRTAERLSINIPQTSMARLRPVR